ncbi:MAG: DUF190 domain-containing protein [Rhizobiaceae bacterium]
MKSTTLRKKIEVLVDAPLRRRLQDIADEAGLNGYTWYRTFGGFGSQGRWFDDQVTGGAGSKLLLTAILDDEKADEFLSKLEPLLDELGLHVMISQVEVIRAERY